MLNPEFCIYDKTTDTYYDNQTFKFILEVPTLIIDIIDTNIDEVISCVDGEDEIECKILYDTGLKDINNKKIYEGDIIELSCGRGVVYIGECYYQTYGSLGNSICMCVYVEYLNGEKEILRKNCEMTYLGNIFEDKELLEGRNLNEI
ncbi:TPA: hypothetical protein LA742_001061 [Clostridium botulinum]|nr:hypothetical protein [Clostridium botulinum]